MYDEGGVRTTALEHVSLTIEKGEFVAVMGPSGSGKSTLLHVLGFLDRHTHGTYLFDGKPAEKYTDDELAVVRNKNIGFIFQAFNLLAKTSVLENVKLPLLYSGTSDVDWNVKARKAIEAVGLTHRIQHESAQLSGGEKQRVAIARALINDPDIIFADEPTGNLDSKSGQAIMEIIGRLNEEGKTIVLITHETYTAEHAKRIINLRDGHIENDRLVAERRSAREAIK